MKKKKGFIIAFLLFLVLPFVFAAPNPPINLAFEDNTDANYDEGVFSVNWDSGGGDPEASYNVYVFSDEVFLMVGPNSSTTGFTVNNPSEAKYTFIVEALNGIGERENSSGNISIIVDSTSPSLDVIGYVKAGAMKNTQNLELNLFVSDSDSGVASSVCVVNVGGANTDISVSGGWCNSTSVSLASASDGNKTIYIQVSDLAGNLAFNNSYDVWIDTSGPAIDFECNPSSVYLNVEVTCSCNATDSGAGVNYTEFSLNPSTSEVGTFTRSCTAVDLLGNSNSGNTDYTVLSGAPYTGDAPLDTSTDSQISWIYTYIIDESEFRAGYTQTLAFKRRIKGPIGSEQHSIGVLEINDSHVTLEIASTPVQKILGIGESVSLDVSGDDIFDIYILLNGIISNSSANLTVQSIHEEISPGTTLETGDNLNDSSNQSNGNETGVSKGKLNKVKVSLLVGGFLFVIISFIIIYLLVGKKSSRELNVKKEEGSTREELQEESQGENVDSDADSETEEVVRGEVEEE